jgi:hypothetical protein
MRGAVLEKSAEGTRVALSLAQPITACIVAMAQPNNSKRETSLVRSIADSPAYAGIVVLPAEKPDAEKAADSNKTPGRMSMAAPPTAWHR